MVEKPPSCLVIPPSGSLGLCLLVGLVEGIPFNYMDTLKILKVINFVQEIRG